jgi:hypothetical protein
MTWLEVVLIGAGSLAFVGVGIGLAFLETTIPLRKAMAAQTALIAAMRAYVASKFGDEVPGEETRPA